MWIILFNDFFFIIICSIIYLDNYTSYSNIKILFYSICIILSIILLNKITWNNYIIIINYLWDEIKGVNNKIINMFKKIIINIKIKFINLYKRFIVNSIIGSLILFIIRMIFMVFGIWIENDSNIIYNSTSKDELYSSLNKKSSFFNDSSSSSDNEDTFLKSISKKDEGVKNSIKTKLSDSSIFSDKSNLSNKNIDNKFINRKLSDSSIFSNKSDLSIQNSLGSTNNLKDRGKLPPLLNLNNKDVELKNDKEYFHYDEIKHEIPKLDLINRLNSNPKFIEFLQSPTEQTMNSFEDNLQSPVRNWFKANYKFYLNKNNLYKYEGALAESVKCRYEIESCSSSNMSLISSFHGRKGVFEDHETKILSKYNTSSLEKFRIRQGWSEDYLEYQLHLINDKLKEIRPINEELFNEIFTRHINWSDLVYEEDRDNREIFDYYNTSKVSLSNNVSQEDLISKNVNTNLPITSKILNELNSINPREVEMIKKELVEFKRPIIINKPVDLIINSKLYKFK